MPLGAFIADKKIMNVFTNNPFSATLILLAATRCAVPEALPAWRFY
jgi:hypothetical protein